MKLLKQEKIVAKKAERESKLISSAVLFAQVEVLKQEKKVLSQEVLIEICLDIYSIKML